MPSQNVIDCSKIIREQMLTIAFAESVTAGRLASEFSLTADSGAILKGGLVCYDASVKEQVLGVPQALVEKYTPESSEVTKDMGMRLKSLIPSDIQVAVTGLTTPGGSEDEHKPVGTIFIHISLSGSSIAVRKVFSGSPEEIVLQAVDLAADTIIHEMKSVKNL
jgi:nicotinamide-nucleotide amidase